MRVDRAGVALAAQNFIHQPNGRVHLPGLNETPGEGDRFGDARMREAVARAGETPDELLAQIERALRDFQSGAALDDRAMLALRFVGAARPRGGTGGAAVTARR